MDTLPKDLVTAETVAYNSLMKAIRGNKSSRLSINIKFEGLRTLPLSLRFVDKLQSDDIQFVLLFPDTGATALAKRDSPQHVDCIFSFNEILKKEIQLDQNKLVILVAPQPFEYNEFQQIVDLCLGTVLMINGKLEDSAVGIGSVARERRKKALLSWENIYWLEPIQRGALMRVFPNEWVIFHCSKDGYRKVKSFEKKPDSTLIFDELTDFDFQLKA